MGTVGGMRRWLLIGALAASCLPGAAWADSEVDILLDKLVDKGILSHVEAGQIRREISETKEARNKQLAKEIVPDSARNWKWKGDIRLRNEYFRDSGAPDNDRNRQRIRFRYGFESKVSDQLKVAAQIATGTTTDPVSTNDSFDDAFNKKPFNLDLAYLTYSPEVAGLDKVEFVGGVMPNPTWTVSPLVWDGDLNFDGVAVKVERKFESMKVFANASMNSLDTNLHESSQMWTTQVGSSITPFADMEEEFLKNLKLETAIGYYNYGDVRGNTANDENNALSDAGGLKGNLLASVHDWNLVNPSFQLSSMISGLPVKFYGDWVHNAKPTEHQNGFALGVGVGKAKKPWSLTEGWEAGYFYERIEPNATFGAFADSDFGGGGTNNKGHVFYLTLATLKNSTLGAKYFDTEEVNDSKDHFDTLQLDWVTKF